MLVMEKLKVASTVSCIEKTEKDAATFNLNSYFT